jgi:hypothetical protein
MKEFSANVGEFTIFACVMFIVKVFYDRYR